jgi:ketopantoate reductase
VVELADRLNVPVPHVRTLYACTKLLDETTQRRGYDRAGG